MSDLEFWLKHWRRSLTDAEAFLNMEPFAGTREILRERVANYRKWIAEAESKLGHKDAA